MAEDTARVLDGDVFEDETFRGGDLAEADLAGKEFVRCAFKNVRLTQSCWPDARPELVD